MEYEGANLVTEEGDMNLEEDYLYPHYLVNAFTEWMTPSKQLGFMELWHPFLNEPRKLVFDASIFRSSLSSYSSLGHIPSPTEMSNKFKVSTGREFMTCLYLHNAVFENHQDIVEFRNIANMFGLDVIEKFMVSEGLYPPSWRNKKNLICRFFSANMHGRQSEMMRCGDQFSIGRWSSYRIESERKGHIVSALKDSELGIVENTVGANHTEFSLSKPSKRHLRVKERSNCLSAFLDYFGQMTENCLRLLETQGFSPDEKYAILVGMNLREEEEVDEEEDEDSDEDYFDFYPDNSWLKALRHVQLTSPEYITNTELGIIESITSRHARMKRIMKNEQVEPEYRAYRQRLLKLRAAWEEEHPEWEQRRKEKQPKCEKGRKSTIDENVCKTKPTFFYRRKKFMTVPLPAPKTWIPLPKRSYMDIRLHIPSSNEEEQILQKGLRRAKFSMNADMKRQVKMIYSQAFLPEFFYGMGYREADDDGYITMRSFCKKSMLEFVRLLKPLGARGFLLEIGNPDPEVRERILDGCSVKALCVDPMLDIYYVYQPFQDAMLRVMSKIFGDCSHSSRSLYVAVLKIIEVSLLWHQPTCQPL